MICVQLAVDDVAKGTHSRLRIKLVGAIRIGRWSSSRFPQMHLPHLLPRNGKVRAVHVNALFQSTTPLTTSPSAPSYSSWPSQ
jgi:hypothetical protein